MAIEMSFILYNIIWIIPCVLPYVLMFVLNRFKLPKRSIKLLIIASILVLLVLVCINAFFAVFILSAYGGEFLPSNDLIFGILLYSSLIETNLLLIMGLLMLILRSVKTLFASPRITVDIDLPRLQTQQRPVAGVHEDDFTQIIDFTNSQEGRWIITVFFSWISFFVLSSSRPINIAYFLSYFEFWLSILTGFIVILFIGASIWTSLALGRILLNKFVPDQNQLVFVNQYVVFIVAIFLGLGFFTLFIHDFLGLGISIITGKELYFPVAYVVVISVIFLGIFLSPILLLRLFGTFRQNIRGNQRFRINFMQIFVAIVMIFFIAFPLLLVPVTISIPDLESSRTALENQIQIADNPIQDYPVNLTNLRVVSRDLAEDISLSRLPSPPKPYALRVMPEYEVIGMINNRPAWVIPMRYESFFNIETNILCGYISVYLDDPIPEHINIVFEEMLIGPGLSGYRNIEWLVTQVRPTAEIGELSFMDPYIDGEPAWLVVLDKYNPWGVRTADTILVVHTDGTYEFLDLSDAVGVGFPELISESAFKDIAINAGLYLRNGQFDPTAKGLITIPPSPDRVVDLGSSYYHFPHHFLTGVNRSWFGRMYYQEITTGDRESVVLWTVINGSIVLYDFRVYSRGGARGVNTPDRVVSDLTTEISDAFQDVGDYYIQQPTLYKTQIQNQTILVWVSLIIQRKQGADELVGAAFVDAANTRIVGVKTRAVGEPLEVFKGRLQETIEQTYLSFGIDEQAGESQTITIENGTILVKEWTGFDSDGRKTYVLRVRDEATNKSYLMAVKWSEAGTGADYYRAAAASAGERYYFKARFDKDEQVFVMINCQEI
ncbi:MAG: hypothetical protein ACFFDI_11045 [Promethearchaeota archaeon]